MVISFIKLTHAVLAKMQKMQMDNKLKIVKIQTVKRDEKLRPEQGNKRCSQSQRSHWLVDRIHIITKHV